MPGFIIKRGLCRRDGKDHPGPRDPPDDIPHFVDIVMVKGAEDVRDALPGQPEFANSTDVDEIHLAEVAFTWVTNWYLALHEKINKYEPLVRSLKRKKYKAFSHPTIFGVTEPIYTHNMRALTQHLGFRKKEAETLLKMVSGTASEWAAKMLISHNKMEKGNSLKKQQEAALSRRRRGAGLAAEHLRISRFK
ncbi:hypothetical protein CYMTET_38032 [Cymbomonas tetramitiformis]|uniref:Uncharacterized protein n=1 Tax=Cymbomonas tetramitiformis TaxID=36881 RepID=A0AAE0CCS4_9CHLO|nr:hypothetical protein CYMTET_38034 [Cymbomonas tetramitiformis]KAK3252688.1 hypothetical protein CYMTET_38032 [Cymbomonas tetramitiformis]